jgi:membrane protein involved in colicin uptake
MSFGISQTFVSNSIINRMARIDPVEQEKIERQEKEELERQEKIKKGEIVDMLYSFDDDDEEKQVEKSEAEKKADEEKEKENKTVAPAVTVYNSIVNRIHNINSPDFM